MSYHRTFKQLNRQTNREFTNIPPLLCFLIQREDLVLTPFSWNIHYFELVLQFYSFKTVLGYLLSLFW